MTGLQWAGIIFGILGWSALGLILWSLPKIVEARADVLAWQEEFDLELDVPDSPAGLDKYL